MTLSHIFLGALGPTELIPIVIAILFFFGGKKIPELMKGIGQGMREFKNAKDGKSDLPEVPKENQAEIRS